MSQTSMLNYEAPCELPKYSDGSTIELIRNSGPVHSLDWCKSSAPGQQMRPRSAFRLGVGSFIENHQNQIAIIGLQDERVLIEDDFTDYPDFVTLCEAHHGYPATNLQWQPASAQSHSWSQKSPSTELLATTGDALRIWEYSGDGPGAASSYVGRPPPVQSGHSLTTKTTLSGVRIYRCVYFLIINIGCSQRFRINPSALPSQTSHGTKRRLT